MSGKGRVISSMVIFGTIGVFVRYLPFASSVIALVRGVIGTLFLIAVGLISGNQVSGTAVRKNFLLLVLSGAAIGFNWILLFESYRYTTVAVATLCYYLAPVFVTLLSPLLLKERLTGRKLACVAAALAGMVFISGVLDTSAGTENSPVGILFGCGAAVLYASVILMNKFLKDISSNDSTVMQLLSAAAVLFPYVLATERIDMETVTLPAVLLLLFVGIVHTGIAYRLYFSAVSALDGQTIALLSYVDPVVAILLSAVILKEPLDFFSVIGAVLILGSAIAGEFAAKDRQSAGSGSGR